MIADDHPTYRRGLAHLFANASCIRLLGAAAHGKQALEIIKADTPDVLITDIKMPVMDGRELCKTVCSRYPGVAVVGHTMFEDAAAISDMRSAGARGYVLKGAPEAELLNAVKAVHDGGDFYCSALRQKLAALLRQAAFGVPGSSETEKFSPCEKAVIRLVCNGKSSKEIAKELATTKSSVDHTKERIEEKMDVKGVVGITGYAYKHWLLYESADSD